MQLKNYMNSCLLKFNTLKMKGLWETPSPEQEKIIALTAAVSSLKSRSTKDTNPKGTNGKREPTQSGKTPGKDGGIFAWKGVAPKEGEPKSKVVKGKTYHWCTHHASPLWSLHKPNAFPNLCRLNPRYAKLEAAHKGGGKGREPAAGDMTLQDALAAIDDSDCEVEE
jgi:hypothetical protein